VGSNKLANKRMHDAQTRKITKEHMTRRKPRGMFKRNLGNKAKKPKTKPYSAREGEAGQKMSRGSDWGGKGRKRPSREGNIHKN